MKIEIINVDEFINFIRPYEEQGNIYIVGAGEFGKLIGKFFTKNEIEWQGYVDGYLKKLDETEGGKELRSYTDSFTENDYFIISSKVYADKMEEQLKAAGVHENNILFFTNIQDIVWELSGAVEDWSKYLQKMQGFHNLYQGQRCFIIGNGPSLSVADLEKLKNEATFACNSIYALYDKTEWRPTFYCVVDPLYLEKLLGEKESVMYLLANCQAAFTTANENARQYRDDVDLKSLFYVRARWAKDKESELPLFSEDCSCCYYSSNTVTYLMLQLAAYMGFHEIYLLGVDLSYSFNYHEDGTVDVSDSYPDGIKQEIKKQNYGFEKMCVFEKELEIHEKGYIAAKQYSDSHGIKIYNASRGGKLEVFERIELDKLFE